LAEGSRSNRNKRKKRIFFRNDIDLERFLKEIQELTSHEMRENSEKARKKKAHPILAYCIRLGPYGRVYIREIGHLGCFAHIKRSLRIAHGLKPLVDIFEEDYEVRVVAELLGVSKEEIKIIGTEKTLIIYVNRQKRKPFLNLDLPCSVNLEMAKATLKNGVLEVVLKKGKSLPSETKRIDIK
jgi:HSP20 family molecular chaperone IbpA